MFSELAVYCACNIALNIFYVTYGLHKPESHCQTSLDAPTHTRTSPELYGVMTSRSHASTLVATPGVNKLAKPQPALSALQVLT